MLAPAYLVLTLRTVAHVIRAQMRALFVIVALTWPQRLHAWFVPIFHTAQHATKQQMLV